MICRFVDGIAGSTILDLNDQVNYFYLDGSEFPIPEVIYSWVENEESKRLASWHLGENKITLKLYIRGSSPQDAYDKLRVLLKRLLKENTLEIRMWGATDSVFYHTYPVTPKLPDFAKKYIIDQGGVTDITIEIPVDKEVKTSAQTITITSAHVVGGAALKGAFGISVPPEEIEGDIPAKMDVHIKAVSDRFTNLVLGQRKEYSSDFDPVQEPVAGTQVMLATRQSGDYRSIAGSVNLLDDGIFAQHGATAGNTTDWDHWAEMRTGTNAWISVESSPVYTGTHSVKVGNSGATPPVAIQLTSDSVAVSIANTYFVQLVCGHSTYKPGQSTVALFVFFYNGAAYLGGKTIATGGQSTSWESLEGYVSPADFPAATTHIKVQPFFYTNAYCGSAYYTYFGQAVFAECVGGTVEAVFPVESHRGKAFVSVGASFADTTAYDDLTLQALMQTSEGEEITSSMAPQVISLGDPDTKFKESFLIARTKLQIPSHGVSGNADLAGIEQLVRLSIDTRGVKNFWYDAIALIYYDRAITEVAGWVDKDYLIFDSRSSGNVLVSLDGTLNRAQAYDHSRWKNPPDFEADPDGINLVLLAVKDVNGDHQLNPVVEMSLVYNPTYLLVK